MKSINFLILLLSLNLSAQKTPFESEEIIYGRKDGMALTMLHLKPQKKNGKAIVKVVSGNWISGNNRISRSIDQSVDLVNNGYSVFLVMHGSQPRYAIPDAFNDIKRSVRFIRHNALKYGIDSNKIGITGNSSGGHLSLLVATREEKMDSFAIDPVNRRSSRIQAAAIFYPPTDFFNWGQPGLSFLANEGTLTAARISGAFDFTVWNDTTTLYTPVRELAARTRVYRDVSPIYSITPDDPPILIFHGDKDRLVPVQQSQTFIDELNKMKVPNRLIIKAGAGHGWDVDETEGKIIREWFDKYLK